MIRILADKNLYQLSAFLPDEVELTLYDPDKRLDIPGGTDALLIRTVTDINKRTFSDFPPSLKFVATGSSGSDHIDKEYLHQNNIMVHDARGCNAKAVAEYVTTGLLLWAGSRQKELRDLTVGIAGCGHVGTALENLLDQLQISCILYDPPREIRDLTFQSASEEEFLSADILSFHTPLTRSGVYPTWHWLSEEKLNERSYACVINAARGGVTDESALIKAFDKGQIECLITDVWENEPDINEGLMQRSFIATPHIAGYSEQAKLIATKMICDQLIRFFDLSPVESDLLSSSKKICVQDRSDLHSVLKELHPICEYDDALRDISGRSDAASRFRKLRTERPFRYEYPNLIIPKDLLEEYPELKDLGCAEG